MPSNAPKGKLRMSLISKRLVSIVASTVLLSLVSAAANAQGTWYTNRALWESLVTNVLPSNYNGAGTYSGENGFREAGVDAYAGTGDLSIGNGYLTTTSSTPVTFNFGANAFCGDFRTSSNGFLDFFVNNSSTYNYRLTTSVDAYSFLGYISNSADIWIVEVSPAGSYKLQVDSFSIGDRKPLDPGSNVAPEPGSFALALTGGAALIGICIRRRRNAG